MEFGSLMFSPLATLPQMTSIDGHACALNRGARLTIRARATCQCLHAGKRAALGTGRVHTRLAARMQGAVLFRLGAGPTETAPAAPTAMARPPGRTNPRGRMV